MGHELHQGAVVAGRYRLDRVLGQGGMGVVWAATHTVTRRSVAIKFLRGPADGRAELRRRFLREARAAATVSHPNVVEVLDVFELEGDTPVMVMDLLHGETLGQRITRCEHLDLAEAAALLLPAVSAIGTAHERGIVHRDLKPDNIFLAKTSAGEVVKVLDFGIAKLTVQAGETGMTETGSTLGTPCYMAPEQAVADKDLDHRVDVWALGVILYECLSGVRPIEGDSIGQIVMHLMSTGITPLERLVPGVPSDIAALVGRMLSRERARRPDDLREVADILGQHTAVRAPAFGAPGSSVAEPDSNDSYDAAPAKVVISGAGADPQGDTQRAPDSLPEAMSSTVRTPPRRRKAAIAAALTIGVAIGAWSFLRSNGQPAPSAPTQAAAAREAPAPTAAAVLAGAEESAKAPIAVAPATDAGVAPAPSASQRDIPRPKAVTRSARAAEAPRSVEKAPASSAAPAPAKPAKGYKGGLAETPPF